MKKLRAFWSGKFDAEDTISVIPYSSAHKIRETDNQNEGSPLQVWSGQLPEQVSQRLIAISKDSPMALFILLLAGVKSLLYKYTNEEKVIVAIPAVRTSDAPLMNETILIKQELNGADAFKSLIAQVHATVSESIVNQNIALQTMAGAMHLQVEPDGSPLFHTVISFDALHTRHHPGSIVSNIELAFERNDDGILLHIHYRDDRYDQQMLELLFDHLVRVYTLALFQPELAIDSIDIMSDEEKSLILQGFNNTSAEYPRERTIHELFEEQAQRTPEQTAVLFEDERLTYRELNERANRLARTLRAEGVGADVPVAIMVERSLEMIVGIYAILKAGGAYVPIDPEYPAERIRYIVEDSGARLLLTQSHFLDRVPHELEGRVLDLNEVAVYAEDATNLPLGAGPRDMAYVIYTSGSTGRPKGAAIEHHSVLNRILWMHERYPIGEADVILQKTTFTFDVSVWELFWWAMVGSSVCLLTPGGEKNPELMLQAISRYGVTTMHFVPAMLHAFLDYAEQQPKPTVTEQTSSLRHVFASGEALPPQHVARFQEAIGRVNRTQLINLYGPTEATVDVSYFDCEPDESYAVIPIGKPVHNTRLYILKEGTEQLQPVGVAGELCIAGVQVARGYLNRPELTAEKFTADPFVAGERMYRTGDLARWLPDGNIEYLGRIDHQVKIRGYRIELGELEAELLAVEAVQEAVVMACDDGQGQKLLCAYFVATKELTAGELREALSKELPSYMLPTYFVQVERMPLTASGKIDRKALPAPEASVQSGEAYVAPRTQTEEQLVRIWQDVLGLEKVGVKDNFFDIGGHSLRAATLAARIHKEMNKQLELREVFEAMTVEQLARTIEGKETKVLVAIPNVPESDYYPVSSAQKRLYVLSNLEGGELGYNMSGAVIAEGALQPDRLEDAFRKLIARHESLRTSFHLVDGEPVQRVQREAAFSLERLDAAGKDVETLFHQFVRPFDLTVAPLLRARLFTQSADRHLLLVDMHHIVSDGVSLRTFLDELARLYNGEELAPLRIQYKDYAVWQQERMQSEEWSKQEQYWLQTFQGEIPTLDLKTDYPRPAVQSFAGDKISFAAGSSVSEGLQKLASRSGSTLYMVLLAAYTALLHKYTGQEDVVVGTPLAGRHHADLEPIIGMFVNTLALRNYPSGNKTFLDYVGEVKEQALGAFDHPDYPFEELVNKLNVRRDMSRNPLFDTMFELRNAEPEGTAFHDVHFSGYPVDSAIAKFDLTLEADFDERGLTFTLEYATALYSRETVERLARHFLRVLEEVVQSPDTKLADIEIMTGDEKAELLEAFSGDGGKGQEHLLATPFHVYFEKQAAAVPEQAAVVAGDAQLTYRELNERANRLARTLQTAGIGRESVVGILADRSVNLLVAVLGVWKAGGAYVPLDPDYPSERIGFMLQDSGATVLLTQTQLKERAQEWLAGGAKLQTVFCLDEEASYDAEASDLPNQNVPQDLAYVIYTSGTTGRPKGVMIEHGSYINTAIAYRRDYRLDQFPVRLLQLASFSFDVFVGDIARVLYNGGLMVIVPKEDRIDPLRLYAWIRDYGITVFESTPALIVPMMEHIASQSLDISTLQLLITSSDSCSVTDYQRLQERYGSHVRIINAYGVTEAAIDSSYYDEPLEKLPEAGNVPIGKAWLNARFYIVDAALQPVPIGVAGELLIGGPGVARGYKNRPELNEEKFIASPFIEGERLYRTGDLARWMADGNVDFIGRMDHQVKIRGYRIELGEIETAILQFAGVKQAVVVDRTDECGQKYLCGYAAASESLGIAELQAHLQQSLPSHMVPAQLVVLEKLPLTPNGKVDRKALPEPKGGLLFPGADYEAPRTEAERTLTSIWQAVLGVPAVGIRDNYFELGGDSIKSLQVSSKLYQNGYKLEIRDLFQNPTIGGLSPYVQRITRVADQGESIGAVELTPVKWWFFEQQYADPHHHNQAVLLYREQGFQEDALRRSISRLVEHHDALRIVIRYSENGPPLAWNRSTREGELYSFDLYDMNGEVDLASAIEAKANEIQSGISLTEGPFVRVGLFRTQAGDHLLIAIHHLVVDGVSWRILFEDLASAYEQALTEEPIRLPQKTDSFQLWAEKLSQYAKGPEIEHEQAYWQNVTERGFEALPKDHEGELSLVGDSDTITVVWTENETEQLLRYANQAYNTEINDLLLTSLGLAVQRWTGMNRVAVNLEGHGREPIIPDLDVSRTVGWFTSQYPVVLDMSANENLQKSIVAVKEGLRGIPNKGIGYGIWRYLSGLFGPQESRQEPEISFNYLGQFDQDLENGSLRFSPYSSGDEISRKAVRTFVLDINGLVSGGVLSLTVSYSRKQYRKETMECFTGLLQSSLREVVAHCAAKTTPTLTPSDVSVRGMTEEELEQIVKETSAIAEMENVYALTPMQQGMLFHALLDSDSGAYFEQTSFDIIGYFDVETFRQSFEALLQRHEIFRTNVYNGWRKQPLQVVYRHREADFAVEDIRGLSEEGQHLRVKRLLREDRQRGFDLTRDVLIRVSILRTGDESYHFLWSSHHILMDGWCLSLVTEEVFEMYFAALEKRKPKLEPVTPYSRYIEWLEARDRDEAAAYWRNYLSGYGEQTLLPSSKAREQEAGPLFGSLFCHLGKPLTEQINRYARQHQITIHTLLQTAWGILLHRYNGTNDAVFGSVVAGRPAEIPGIERMIGLFINTVPVRIRCEAGDTFTEVVTGVQRRYLESNAYDSYPLFEIQASTEQKQELVNHIMVFENFPVEDQMSQIGSGEAAFKVENIEIAEQTNYDFNLIVAPGENLLVRFEYNTRFYHEADVQRIQAHLTYLLEQVVANPDIRIHELELVSGVEKEQILHAFNDTAVNSPREKTIYQLLEEQTARTPEQAAVYCEGQRLTYRELNERANRLARTLRSAGVQ
ncbi:non-ribosomal peptide synthase domain TIGR01720/amino acid adenylation domain-containing protein, partial [Paenibacillus tianmuensis]